MLLINIKNETSAKLSLCGIPFKKTTTLFGDKSSFP